VKFLLATIVLQLFFLQTESQQLTTIASLHPRLDETSGLEYTPDGMIWTIIDSEHPTLFGLDSTGAMTRAIHLNNLNNGWEDLSQDDEGNFYIGDFGNNRNTRQNLKIYKIPNPSKIEENIITAEIIAFSYPDQKEFPPPYPQMNFDMDAMVCFNDSLFLFSKNRTWPYTGYSKVYRLPTAPGTYVAELVDSVYLGPGHMFDTWVTGAAMSPDRKTLALLTHDKIWLYRNFKGSKFFSGEKKTIQLNHYSQKEGIVFRDENTLYLSDERTFIFGGNLYLFKLCNIASNSR
jgi:hypothetical protein